MSDLSQVPASAPANTVVGVFAVLTAKAGVTREQVMAFMPAEIRATVRLYLGGKIREWYARADGRGAVFLLDVKSVEEAEALMDTLPLGEAHLLDHSYIPVSPLKPLGLLLPSAAAKE